MRKGIKSKKEIVKSVREPYLLPSGNSIAWLKLEILKMQTQLAVALRNNNIVNVRRLISKIIRSNLTQQFAVYRTISSSGAKSKGIQDKIRPTTHEQYETLRKDLWKIIKDPNKYKATPLKRVWLPKPNSKDLRPISVPNYVDRALQHLFLIVLEVISEEHADRFSFGFRPFRSPGWAAKALTTQIWSRKGFEPPKYAMEIDIRKCFDSISHNFITELMTKYDIQGEKVEIINTHIIQQWLKCGYIDIKGTISPKDTVIPTISGIPQGGPISPTIANMVLDKLEERILKISADLQPTTGSNITEFDNVIWKYEGKEIICSINTDINNTTIINKTIRDLGYDPPKGMARLFYKGTWIHKRGPWSYEIKGTSSTITSYRDQKNAAYIFIIRYADDVVILFNSIELENKIKTTLNEFLTPRGLELNPIKTQTKSLHTGDKITFVGYEFSIIKKTGKWKVYNYPPASKVLNIKQKVHELFLKYKFKPYIAFYKVNAVLRGWLNYYRTANSKAVFQTLHEWLFKRTYKFLTVFLRQNKKYRIKSQRYKKKILGHDLWKDFRFFSVHKSISKWFGIPKEMNPNTRWSKLDSPIYMLIQPKFIEVSTPSFISGLSAYHPDDRIKLGEKAIYWRPGLIKDLLIKSKGVCKNCNCLLTDNSTDIEIHHIKPLKYDGKQKFTNLAVLCKECHAEVTAAVKSKNIDQIILYEQNKILLNISDLFIAEAEQTTPKEV
uniref:Reverse transcriptase domain-containing protein n=1 Tax=Euglena anabaena TaxID=38273 RepID=A0A0G3F6P4_EUGAN|nr:hypothetical protein [Euglenaria anabaena]AKJ83321.1 hypothetical protein [Euglenaria anabaena]